MTRHTPGPWRVWDKDPTVIVDSDDVLIGCSLAPFRSVDENIANVRLCAAAPELYEAAQRAALLIEEAIGVPPELKALWAAIKKTEAQS